MYKQYNYPGGPRPPGRVYLLDALAFYIFIFSYHVH